LQNTPLFQIVKSSPTLLLSVMGTHSFIRYIVSNDRYKHLQ
jgi:hypothetical protein